MLSQLDKKIIRELQQDIPLVERPFKQIAEKIGISEEELLQKINCYMEKGYIRRFGAALRHREMGITANPMIVMKVSEENILSVGETLASYPEVTHCYQRPPQPEFPYNLFAMIHCHSKKECDKFEARIKNIDEIEEYKFLYSTKELKKTSMKYFIEE